MQEDECLLTEIHQERSAVTAEESELTVISSFSKSGSRRRRRQRVFKAEVVVEHGRWKEGLVGRDSSTWYCISDPSFLDSENTSLGH